MKLFKLTCYYYLILYPKVLLFIIQCHLTPARRIKAWMRYRERIDKLDQELDEIERKLSEIKA